MAQPEYEFTTEQNAVIGDVALKVRHVSFLMFLMTLILLVQLAINLAAGVETHIIASSLAAPVAAAGLGYLLLRGANYLRSIVTTEGHDIRMLLNAFAIFRNFYVVLWILVAIGTISRIVDSIV